MESGPNIKQSRLQLTNHTPQLQLVLRPTIHTSLASSSYSCTPTR